MKMIAFATIAMLGLFVIGGAVPGAEVVGEAAAVVCAPEPDLGVDVDPCGGVCYVAQQLQFECTM